MAGGHDVRQAKQRLERLVGIAAPGTATRCCGESGPRLALAAVDHTVAKVAAPDAADGGAVQAVRTEHVAEDERGDHQITGCHPMYFGTVSSTTPMNSCPMEPTA